MKNGILLLFIFSLAAGFASGRYFSKTKPIDRPSASVRPKSLEAAPDQVSETVIPFTWSRLESTNYQEYVNNLRSVRCPERTIADIIRADLTKLYAPKFAGLTKAADSLAEMKEKVQQKWDADIKIESILYKQLNLARPVRSPGPLFTAEQEEKITESGRLFPTLQPDPTDPDRAAKIKNNHTARIQFLSQYLSPEELLYYKLDREGVAMRVNGLLGGMQPTKDEFLAVATVIGNLDWRSTIPGRLKPDAIEAVRSALSPERLEFFLNLQKPEYQDIRVFVQTHQLEPYVANSLVSLRQNLFEKDFESYTQQVKAILTNPRDRAMYLQNKTIHPDKSQ